MTIEDDLLDYLEHRMPDYPFDPDLDRDFLAEIIDDFDQLDLLEELKAFRWYHDNQPGKRFRNLRIALRRWLSYAWTNREIV